MAVDLNGLAEKVDWERGQISADIFIDDEIYRMELERLFSTLR